MDEAEFHSGMGLGVDSRCVNVQDVVSGVLPLHDVQNLEHMFRWYAREMAGKGSAPASARMQRGTTC